MAVLPGHRCSTALGWWPSRAPISKVGCVAERMVFYEGTMVVQVNDRSRRIFLKKSFDFFM